MANINLIDDKLKYSDGEIHDAVLREIRFGTNLKVAMEEERAKPAKEVAADFRKHNRTVGSLGKVAAVLPNFEYFYLVRKYGQEEVHSREFLRSLRRHEPDYCVNRV